ncbi:unnamed protein product [Polarella glacialis]|uniref:Uncharacterized protein n=1 Tax=Polarella glacialis TaxID=89957 RepID=A0A813JX65_POLGL|nr:unnamed protein product [Polarella glacialis]
MPCAEQSCITDLWSKCWTGDPCCSCWHIVAPTIPRPNNFCAGDCVRRCCVFFVLFPLFCLFVCFVCLFVCLFLFVVVVVVVFVCLVAFNFVMIPHRLGPRDSHLFIYFSV